MFRRYFALLALSLSSLCMGESALPHIEIIGFSISAPKSETLARFVAFIENELAPRNINTLVLRVDYRFEFKTHPELIADNALGIQMAQ
jgi:hypothetical protein